MSQEEKDRFLASDSHSIELAFYEGKGADGPLYAVDFSPHGEIVELTINNIRINIYDPADFSTLARVISDSVKELREHVKVPRAKPSTYRSLG